MAGAKKVINLDIMLTAVSISQVWGSVLFGIQQQLIKNIMNIIDNQTSVALHLNITYKKNV